MIAVTNGLYALQESRLVSVLDKAGLLPDPAANDGVEGLELVGVEVVAGILHNVDLDILNSSLLLNTLHIKRRLQKYKPLIYPFYFIS